MQISQTTETQLLPTGFSAFKKRLREELIVRFGINLDDYANDFDLMRFYREGESPEFVADIFGTRCSA